MQEIETERLTVRPIAESDWEAIREIWLDFKQSPYVYYDTDKNTEPDDVKKRVARWAEATRSGKTHVFFVSCLKGSVIGFFSLNQSGQGYEIGYGFRESFQGKGYARESLTAILAYAKTLGAGKIYAGTALKNLPSVHLLESVGFQMVSREYLSFFQDENGKDIIFEGGNFVLSLSDGKIGV